jgi:DNA-directed RNA polymerase II subunit RPB2
METKQSPAFSIAQEVKKSIENLMPADLPLPPPIRKVVTAVGNNKIFDTPGEIKVDKSGKLLQEFLYFDGLTLPMIEAYDTWLNERLPEQIIGTNPFVTDMGKYTFVDVKIFPPLGGINGNKPVYPQDARTSHGTYAVTVTTNLKFTPNEKGLEKGLTPITSKKNITIGKIPLMLGSSYCYLSKLSAKELEELAGECSKDPFGYFIVKGNEKIILLHEKLRVNKPLIFMDKLKKSEPVCRFTSSTLLGTTITTLFYSKDDFSLQLTIFDSKTLVKSFNVFHVFQLLGIPEEKDIQEMIMNFVSDDVKNKVKIFLSSSFWHYSSKKAEVVEVLGKLRELPLELDKNGTSEEKTAYYRKMVDDNLFRQMSGFEPTKKLTLLAILIARYSEHYVGKRAVDDRDSWVNKRVLSAGPAMEQLFNMLWGKKVNELQEFINGNKNDPNLSLDSIINMFNPGTFISDNFVSSFDPNKWGLNGIKIKANMTDFIKNDTLLSKYSQILRIQPQTSTEGKQLSIRLVHGSQMGLICPVATPEGKRCGIVKEIAVGCYTSVIRKEEPIINIVKAMKLVSDVKTTMMISAFILNGKVMGWCDGLQVRKILRNLRKEGKLYKDILIYFEEPNMLWVYTDSGRLTQPLLTVNDNQRLTIEEKNLWDASFIDLIKAGAVEYLDPTETEEKDCLIAETIWDPIFNVDDIYQISKSATSQRDPFAILAMQEGIIGKKKKYSHCFMDPSAMLSVLASIIPMPERNQAPRNSYQCSMGKQALGIQHTNAINRFDTEVKSLMYPTRPLFETEMYQMIGLDQLPAGENVMVAIMPYLGFNQEDSIIINKGALDRGRFRIVRTITCKTVEVLATKDGSSELIGLPPNAYIQGKKELAKKFRKLGPNNIVRVGEIVKEGDCLVAKTKKSPNGELSDVSYYVGLGQAGIVERVLVSDTGFSTGNYSDNRKVVSIKIREMRIPQAGDKFASRYAQKGTIGLVLPEEDMPFVASGKNKGVRPDILINPHGIPSRMTQGKIIEIIASKAAAITGNTVNCTSFRPFNIDELRSSLFSNGFSPSGYERLANGMTGTLMSVPIYMGPCYYQALRHHVKDKIQSRARGPSSKLTRQPISGRALGGAIKIEEMGRDACISHGISNVLKEKFEQSDAFKTIFCKSCKYLSSTNINNLNMKCPVCGKKEFGLISIPYSFKLLIHELSGAGLLLKLNVKEKQDQNISFLIKK